MRIIIQRVKNARVTIQKHKCQGQECQPQELASIGQGLLLLVGFGKIDQTELRGSPLRGSPTWNKILKKIVNLRIFPDQAHKLNWSLLDIGGELLVVSQFTLFANLKKGLRPSFDQAAPPETAKELFSGFITDLQDIAQELTIKHGIFGANMDIQFINWGPVTIILDSETI